MSRFDLYQVQSGPSYLLDLQTDLLDIQSTRMMAPVLPKKDVPDRIRSLHPTIKIGEDDFVLATHLMAAVPKTLLRAPVTNLSRQADEITRALDLLFQGY